MPGCKRGIDEDRWLGKQLKKFKFSPADANVYASTLEKLRQGARQAFSRDQASADQGIVSASTSTNHQLASTVDTATRSPGSTASNDTSIEGMVADILTDGEEMDTSSCEDCTRKLNPPETRNGIPGTDSMERCSYCEKNTCHLNYCKLCTSGFCTACCIPRYDEPTEDTFLCISCLNNH